MIIPNAVSTHVFVPPFLKTAPLFDAMTTGLTLFGVITVGAWPEPAEGSPNNVFGIAAAATVAAVVARTKSRRFSFLVMASSFCNGVQSVGRPSNSASVCSVCGPFSVHAA